MFRHPFLRRFGACLALWAMLAGVVQPVAGAVLGQAMRGPHDPAGWVQVCSSNGMFWVRADTVGTADTQSSKAPTPAPDTTAVGHHALCASGGCCPPTGSSDLPVGASHPVFTAAMPLPVEGIGRPAAPWPLASLPVPRGPPQV